MPEILKIILIVLGSVVILSLIGGIVFMLIKTIPISNMVYKKQLVRTSGEVWGRNCSAPENEEQVAMWEEGCAWADKNKDRIKEVHIVSYDGLNLYGEFFDFNSDNTVIILPGRCECLKYSYFYAKPYQDAGYNVLCIDTRCHGLSDGTHSSIGKKESKDVIAWANFLQKEFNTKKVCLHCICIGSSSGILALTNKNCPSIIQEICVEGCFTNFRESFKEHMIYEKRPTFPVLDLVMLNIFFHTGTNVLLDSPIKKVGKIKAKMLFLHTELDLFSKPEKAVKLYEKCGSDNKKIVWFKKGGHSHIRINNHEEYDNAIVEWLTND